MNEFQHLLLQVTPFLFFVLIAILVGGAVFLGSDRAVKAAQPYSSKLKDRLDRANVNLKTEDIGIALVGVTLLTWAALVFFGHLSLLYALFSAPITGLLVFKAFGKWVDIKIARRLSTFNNQLEIILRMMSSAIRSGLGLRQALIMVTEEMPDPARYEFNLTIKQTNIGMSTNDALARLALRMPSQELEMLTKAIAVQTQTGGNLGKTIDHLANTIKDRRKLFRKVKSLTAESRASAMVIGALPIFVAAFLMLTQAPMRDAVLGTDQGHIVIAIASVLEGLGIFVLVRLLDFKV